MPYHAHAFVDGAYLRERARDARLPWVSPHSLASSVVVSPVVQGWGAAYPSGLHTALTRVVYYDARPDADADVDPNLADYWKAIELQPDTELGFGSLRGGNRRRLRQKGVDTLIAVDMLVGAFTKLFQIAVLVTGDADFVPVLNEVRRRGVMVVLAAVEDAALSLDLRRAADRFVRIEPKAGSGTFPELQIEGRTWRSK